ncbi:TetR/AcrR family transcriptional regulator [Microbacterium flavescens]|jgi:AcrR family transcriptional regulator|uniref:TetR/AcrR family transcriptional regulator n=1 Tax=Microbacterium flavescens TaxID=69366 RepID=UPI001BDF4A8F|nr:TetR/AcrR family transcriptional regulator [Microbacterium flavescens]BFF09459.1 TetR/AcrR family transcriptional regulator [Microbacterium flavescens]
MAQEQRDGRRLRGDESRRVILAHAIDTASVDGLEGLTIGRLADAAGHSKSGVATLFGSKEQLQLATVAAAREVFIDTVVAPARANTDRGLARVCALLEKWLDYSEDRVFSGGCFFAATSVEYDARPGVVRDAIAAASSEWEDYLAVSIEYAMNAGELPLLDDARQLTFELVSFLEAANTRSLLHESAEPYRRAATAARARLIALGGDPELVATVADPS